MPTPRLYQATPISLHKPLRLDEKATHHLVRVLRAKVGDTLRLFNGEGGEYEATIAQIEKKTALVYINTFSPCEVESPLQLYLAQSLVRSEKMDFIVQKAVELGVHQIMPLATERSSIRLTKEQEEKRLQHWQTIAIHACEQCGRNRIPTITPLASFASWLPTLKADHRFILSPHAQNKLADITIAKQAGVLLLIGPEGGFSDQEIKITTEHGFLPINLGPRVLRTETAPLAAITLFQYCFGDLGLR